MRSSSALRLTARILFLCVLILSVPAMALAVLYAKPLEPLRRANVEHFLSEAIDTEVEVRGPITIGFDWAPTITIDDIVAAESELPTDLKGLSARSVKLEVPLLSVLAGSVQLNALVVDGLKVYIEIPEGGAEADEGGVDVTEVIGDLVRSPVAGDLLLREPKFDYVNHDSGFQLHYVFDEIESQPSNDGGVAFNGRGELNGEPWKLDGDVDSPGEDDDKRKFALALNHAGLKLSLAGAYEFDAGLLDFDGDTVDMTVAASAPRLKHFLAIYNISGDLQGTANLSAHLAGSLDALTLSDLASKLVFETGDTYELTGAIADLAEGTGLDLRVDGTFARKPPAEGAARPIYDIGITGFDGRIEGSLGGMQMRDFHILTSAITANLRDIGPITAERLYKDKDGRLGLYDVLILAGDPKRPSVRVAAGEGHYRLQGRRPQRRDRLSCRRFSRSRGRGARGGTRPSRRPSGHLRCRRFAGHRASLGRGYGQQPDQAQHRSGVR